MTTKIAFHADNDVNSQAEAVNAAMIKENCDLYCFVGDGPYSESGTGWVAQQKKHFDDKKDKMIWSRGNHDEDESESKQTQKDMEAWFPEAKGVGISDCWLSSRQVGNVYVISMDTQDLDVEFKRDQFNWVTSELTKAKQLRNEGKIDWIVILFHKPFFTLKSSHSPYTAVRFLYKDLFRDAQVDFCVSGHNHNTQLWLPMVPNQSQANGEGEQLFTLAADNKTFDFAKDHGQLFIVSGHSAHEWNSINDSGAGVKNVMHYRDEGDFGFTLLTTDGKKANVKSIDTTGKVHYDYNVTREGAIGPPPPPPCKDNECKDPVTNECRAIGSDEEKDVNGFCKKIPPIDPDPSNGVVCPQDYEYDPSLGHCIPTLTPQIGPKCPTGYKWNSVTKVCDKDSTQPPPVPCLQGECKDPNTGQCRPIGPDEIKDSNGFCRPKPIVVCPDGQCKDVNTGQCRAIGANEEKDVNGFCKKKTTTDPGGNVLWDSNVHLKTGQAYTIDGEHGSQEANGKGVFMAASGNPRLKVDADGTFHLEADAGHGRVYIKATNFNARMEGECKIETDSIDNTTWRLRSRHGESGACENRFGGFGATCERNAAEYQTELCHNLHENSISKPLAKNITVGQWFKFRYSCCNNADNTKVLFKTEYDYNDGNGFVKVGEGEHPSPKPYYMDKAKFMEESYAWLRINNESTGSVAYKNVKIVEISSIDDSGTTPTPNPTPEPEPEPNPTPTPTPTPGEGEVDANGVIWFLPEVKGKQTTVVKQSRDEADDDRWSQNVAGCEDGFEQTMIAKSIGIASDGHFASKLGGSNHSGGNASKQRWMDLGVRSNGDVQLQWEGPHPSNHDFDLPDSKLFIKNIGKELEGNWVGLKWAQNILKKGGSPANGGVRWRMWVNTDIANDGKPDNTKWKLVLDFIDGVDVKVIQPQDFVMTGTMDVEVRRSNTKSHEVFGGGLMIRPFN